MPCSWGKWIGAVERVRTLAVTISPLLANLMTDVLQPRLALDLVGVLASRAALAETLRTLTPELVIFGLLADETDAVAHPFLAVLPSAVILVLSDDGKSAWLLQRRRRRLVLYDLSLAVLAEALSARFVADPPKG